MSTWRRIFLLVGYLLGGLLSLLMAVALANGVVFSPTGAARRYGPPQPWHGTEVDSPVGQAVGVLAFAIAGFWLLWQSYKLFNQK
jgi:hypothetical protein